MTEKDLVSFYLDDIKEYEVLDKDEEVSLLKRAKNGDIEARERLILCNLRLVVNVAKKYGNKGMGFIDLISEGNFGLIHAIEKFDVEKGYRFSTYAVWWIKQAISKAIISKGREIRIPSYKHDLLNKINKFIMDAVMLKGDYPSIYDISDGLGINLEKVQDLMVEFQETVSLSSPIGEDIYLEDTIASETHSDLEDTIIRDISAEQINEILNKLNEREKQILKLRFGFDGNQIHTLEDIGQSFSITRERVRQIEQKTLEKLRIRYSDLLKGNYYY
ncbi:MAG: sigma-70 family RNA polymerase sigma factor [Cetobacterium sp.]|uniref:sigma-70 family RNA polymerase sigma factor n=1 Tax=unclassified Cetobacterium TaxID=2630983 RepID=UPI0006465247|nr:MULTISPECIES: sigma-70 family RNA polymerase sigma factor [unclassified Cetobacterium]